MPPTCSICGREAQAGASACPHDGADADRGTEPTAIRDPIVGRVLGQYQVTDRLGEGGMGVVYRAVQPVIGKEVAVKLLKRQAAEDPVAVKRLLEEARAVSAIRHRGIIDIFGFGQLDSGEPYIVMELLQGQALDELLRERGRLDRPEAAHILDEVLSALGAAHGAGVIHRDVKPNNIFLVSLPGVPRFVKLLDFGLVKREGRTGPGLTRTNVTVGTPQYIAPEQAMGTAVSPRTDLYSVGVVAFEVLAGRLPFVESSVVDYLRAHITQPPPRLSSAADVPPALDEWVARMLEKEPERRPSSAEEARVALQRAMQAPTRGATAVPSRPRASGPRPALAAAQRTEQARHAEAETVIQLAPEARHEAPPPQANRPPGWLSWVLLAIGLAAAGFFGWQVLT